MTGLQMMKHADTRITGGVMDIGNLHAVHHCSAEQTV